MELKNSIKNAENFAYVGAQIGSHFLQWFGEKSIEGVIRGSDVGYKIASEGLRLVGRTSKRAVENAEQAIGTGPEIAHNHALKAFQDRLNDTRGLIEESSNPDLHNEIWRMRVEATLEYSDFCIEHGITVDVNCQNIIATELILGSAPKEKIDHVFQNLKVQTADGEIIYATQGLEDFFGKFDPSVPRDLYFPQHHAEYHGAWSLSGYEE